MKAAMHNYREESSMLKRRKMDSGSFLDNRELCRPGQLVKTLKSDSPSSIGSSAISNASINLETRFIESVDLLKDLSNSTFKPYFPGFKAGLRVTLEYPNSAFKEKFFLVTGYYQGSKGLEPDNEEYNPITDIISTIENVASLMADSKDKDRIVSTQNGLLRKLNRARNRREGDMFLEGVKEYNALVRDVRDKDGFLKPRIPDYELLEHILFQVYARVASPDADKLTDYEAFSNQVYGEVNANLVDEFIKISGIKKDELFIDMGSGIGNVVLQVACQTGCRAHGIEIMPLPATLSRYQQLELRARMAMYNLPIPKIKFYKGDFLEHPSIISQLPQADVLLVNNYVFDSALNVRIMELFLTLKDGCKIISLKNFAPLELKINARNAGEPQSILRVKRYEYGTDSVSWTANPGQFFVHTVDRRPLNRFLSEN